MRILPMLGLAMALHLPAAAMAQEGVMARSTVKGYPAAVCGSRAYVSNSYSRTLSVIDLAKGRLFKNLATGNAPVNPDVQPRLDEAISPMSMMAP